MIIERRRKKGKKKEKERREEKEKKLNLWEKRKISPTKRFNYRERED
jgi:hypothetical protein